MDEFQAIERLFRPLASEAPEALDLKDDAALIAMRPGSELVVTQDALVEGRHFLKDARPEDVASRLLRSNLSDLAAKGAEPFGYFLTIAWPAAWDDMRRTRFAEGLRREQELFGVKLFGGDTVSTDGPLVISATLLGWVPQGMMVKRAGARAGDALMVSGTIGDAFLGLQALKGEIDPGDDGTFLVERFHRPQPRLELRALLRRVAHAAADVSDGLLADAANIASASHLGVEIDLDRLPLSPAAQRWIANQTDDASPRAVLAAAGDDYELVLAVPQARVDDALANASDPALTIIGQFVSAPGLKVSCAGVDLLPAATGWRHV